MVGQSAPLTGDNAAFGTDIRDGAAAFFKSVNDAGGIGGKRIELITLDDGNDRKRATENAGKLLTTHNASVLFGFASATLSLDALPLAEKVKVPVFGVFTGAPIVFTSPVSFTIRPTYEQEMDKLLAFWQSNGIQRVTVLHYDDEVGLQNLKSVKDRLATYTKQPITSMSIKRNAPLSTDVLEAIIKSDPELLMSTVASAHAAKVVLDLRKAGKFYYVSSTSFVGASQFAKLVGTQGVGVSVTQVVPSPTSLTIPVVVECRRVMSAVQVQINYTNLESCIGAKILVEALRRTGRDTTRSALLNTIQTLGTYDAGGFNVTFSRSSRQGSRWVDLTVINKQGTYGS